MATKTKTKAKSQKPLTVPRRTNLPKLSLLPAPKTEAAAIATTAAEPAPAKPIPAKPVPKAPKAKPILGEKHLRHLLNEFVGRYYHFERPHQGIDNVPPMADEEPSTVKFPAGRVRCRKRLGGLLKSYYRSAA